MVQAARVWGWAPHVGCFAERWSPLRGSPRAFSANRRCLPALPLGFHHPSPVARSCLPQVTADNTLYTSAATFEELGLSPELLQGLYSEMKFERPSKVQARPAGRRAAGRRVARRRAVRCVGRESVPRGRVAVAFALLGVL